MTLQELSDWYDRLQPALEDLPAHRRAPFEAFLAEVAGAFVRWQNGLLSPAQIEEYLALRRLNEAVRDLLARADAEVYLPVDTVEGLRDAWWQASQARTRQRGLAP